MAKRTKVATTATRGKEQEAPPERRTRKRRDWGGTVWARADRGGRLFLKYRDASGRTIVCAAKSQDRTDAERELAVLTGKVGADVERGVRAVTIKSFWKDEVRDVFKARLGERQFPNVEAQVLRANEAFGDTPMFRIDRAALEAYFVVLRKEGKRAAPEPGGKAHTGPIVPLRTATLARHKSALMRLWAAAIDRGAATVNPLHGIALGRAEETAPSFFTAEELAKLYQHLPATIRPLVVLLGESGARFSEIAKMNWPQVSTGFERLTFTRTKSGRVRHVPCTPLAVEALKQLHERHVVPMEGEDRVLAGYSVSHSYVLRTFHAALTKAGLRKTGLHALRHSYCSGLISAGASVSVVKELAGHSNVSVTNRYVHAAAGEADRAVQALARSRGEGTEPTKTARRRGPRAKPQAAQAG